LFAPVAGRLSSILGMAGGLLMNQIGSFILGK